MNAIFANYSTLGRAKQDSVYVSTTTGTILKGESAAVNSPNTFYITRELITLTVISPL